MKKKFFSTLLFVGVLILGSNELMASNSVEIVSNGTGPRNISRNGETYLTNSINEEKTNLSNGSVAIDITIHNSQKVDVMYAFNNNDSLKELKENIIYKISQSSATLSSKYTYQGYAYTNNNGVFTNGLSNKDIAQELNSLLSAQTSNEINYVYDLLESSSSKFSNDSKAKYLFLFTSTLPTFTEGDQNRIKTLVNTLDGNGITLIVYAIDSSDDVNTLKSMFGTNNVVSLSSTNLSSINILDIVEDSFVSKKENFNTSIILDDSIVNNFDVTATTSKSSIVYDKDNKMLVLSPTTLEANEDITISYTLKLNDEIDSTILQMPSLRTDRQVKISFVSPTEGNVNGFFPTDNKIEDDICSPLIKVIEGTIVNPDTGVYNYIIMGACFLAVGLVTLVLLNNKNAFNSL